MCNEPTQILGITFLFLRHIPIKIFPLNTHENTVPENEISEDEQDEGSAFSISM